MGSLGHFRCQCVNLILFFILYSQYTVRMFPDGLVTVDVVQCINGVSEGKILKRAVR